MKILPTDIQELKYLKTIKYDIDLYAIDETIEDVNYNGIILPICKGQLALRNMLNVNYRIKENPWCILKNITDPTNIMYGKLSLLAIWSWHYYSNFPKIAAFRHNKLIAIKHASKSNPDFLWWDRQNFPYAGCPVVVNGKLEQIDDVTNEQL